MPCSTINGFRKTNNVSLTQIHDICGSIIQNLQTTKVIKPRKNQRTKRFTKLSRVYSNNLFPRNNGLVLSLSPNVRVLEIINHTSHLF